MPIRYSRSLWGKRPLQSLLILLLIICVLIGLPRSILTGSMFDLRSIPSSNKVNLKYEAALVVASRVKDNTAWLQGKFPAWKKSIYVVDDPKASLTVPVNKGREAMVYLTCVSRSHCQEH